MKVARADVPGPWLAISSLAGRIRGSLKSHAPLPLAFSNRLLCRQSDTSKSSKPSIIQMFRNLSFAVHPSPGPGHPDVARLLCHTPLRCSWARLAIAHRSASCSSKPSGLWGQFKLEHPHSEKPLTKCKP